MVRGNRKEELSEPEARDPWSRLSVAELRRKRSELLSLIGSKTLTDRSKTNQWVEIGIIEAEIEKRDVD